MSTDASFDVSLDYNTLVTEIDAIVDINSKCYELLSTICEASDAVGMLESGYLLINAFNTVDDIINGPIRNTLMHIMDVESLFNIFQNKDFYADYFSNADADGDGNPDIDYDKLLTVMVSLVNTQEECFQLVDNYDEVLERYSVMLRDLDKQIAIYEQSEIVDLNSFDRDYIVQQIEKQNEALSNLPQLRSEYAELVNIMSIVRNIRDYTYDKGFFLYGGDENFDSLSGDIDIRIVDAKLLQNKDYKGTLFGDDPDNQFYWEFYDKDGNILTEDDVSIIETSIFFANQEKYTGEGCSEKFAEYSRAYSYLNDQEVKIANYLYNSGNFDKLEEFLQFKESYANGREGAERAQEILAKIDGYYANALTDSQKNLAYTKTLGLLAGTGFVDGWGSFFEGFSNLVAADGEVSVEQYKTMEIIKALNSKDKDAIGKWLDGDWQTTGATGSYEIFNSIGNMVPSMIIGAVTHCPQLGSALMGVSLAGNAREQGLQAGMSELEAWQYGILSGASEAATEFLLGGIPYLSSADELTDLLKNPTIRKIINANPKAMKFFNSGLYRYGENMVSEGIEEMFQTGILEPAITAYVTGEVPDVSFGEVLKSGAYGMVSSGITQGAVNTGKGVLNLAVNHSFTNGPTIILDNNSYSMKNMSDEFISDFVGKYGNQDLSDPNVLAQVKADLAPYIVGGDSDYQKGSDTTIPVVSPKSKIPPSAQQAKKIVETARTVIEEQGRTLPIEAPVVQDQGTVVEQDIELDTTGRDELTYERKDEIVYEPIASQDEVVGETPIIVEEKATSEIIEQPVVSKVKAEDLTTSAENEVRTENISSDSTQSSTDMTSGLAVSGLATAVTVSHEALSTKVNGDIDTPVLSSDIVVDDGSSNVTSEFDLDDETGIDVVSENVTVNLQDKSNRTSTEEQVSGTVVTDDFLHEVTDEEFEDGTELGPDERLAGRIGFQYFAKPKTNSGTVVDGINSDMTINTEEVAGTVTDAVEVDSESGDISVDTTTPRNILVDGKNFIVKMCSGIKDFVSAKQMDLKLKMLVKQNSVDITNIINSSSDSILRFVSTKWIKRAIYSGLYSFSNETPFYLKTKPEFILASVGWEKGKNYFELTNLDYSMFSSEQFDNLIFYLSKFDLPRTVDLCHQPLFDYIIMNYEKYPKLSEIAIYYCSPSLLEEYVKSNGKLLIDNLDLVSTYPNTLKILSLILSNPKQYELNIVISALEHPSAIVDDVNFGKVLEFLTDSNYRVNDKTPVILKSNFEFICSSIKNSKRDNNVFNIGYFNFDNLSDVELDEIIVLLEESGLKLSNETSSRLIERIVINGDLSSRLIVDAINLCSPEILTKVLYDKNFTFDSVRFLSLVCGKNSDIVIEYLLNDINLHSKELVINALNVCCQEVFNSNLDSILLFFKENPELFSYTFSTLDVNINTIIDNVFSNITEYSVLIPKVISCCPIELLLEHVDAVLTILESDSDYQFNITNPNDRLLIKHISENSLLYPKLIASNSKCFSIDIIIELVNTSSSDILKPYIGDIVPIILEDGKFTFDSTCANISLIADSIIMLDDGIKSIDISKRIKYISSALKYCSKDVLIQHLDEVLWCLNLDFHILKIDSPHINLIADYVIENNSKYPNLVPIVLEFCSRDILKDNLLDVLEIVNKFHTRFDLPSLDSDLLTEIADIVVTSSEDYSNLVPFFITYCSLDILEANLPRVLSDFRIALNIFSHTVISDTPGGRLIADYIISNVSEYGYFVTKVIDYCSPKLLEKNLDSVFESLNRSGYIFNPNGKNADLIASVVFSNLSKYSALAYTIIENCSVEMLEANIVNVMEIINQRERFNFNSNCPNALAIADFIISNYSKYSNLAPFVINYCSPEILNDNIDVLSIVLTSGEERGFRSFKYFEHYYEFSSTSPNARVIADFVIENASSYSDFVGSVINYCSLEVLKSNISSILELTNNLYFNCYNDISEEKADFIIKLFSDGSISTEYSPFDIIVSINYCSESVLKENLVLILEFLNNLPSHFNYELSGKNVSIIADSVIRDASKYPNLVPKIIDLCSIEVLEQNVKSVFDILINGGDYQFNPNSPNARVIADFVVSNLSEGEYRDFVLQVIDYCSTEVVEENLGSVFDILVNSKDYQFNPNVPYARAFADYIIRNISKVGYCDFVLQVIDFCSVEVLEQNIEDVLLVLSNNGNYEFNPNSPNSRVIVNFVMNNASEYYILIPKILDYCSCEILIRNMDNILKILNNSYYNFNPNSPNANVIADAVIKGASKYPSLVSMVVYYCSPDLLIENITDILDILNNNYNFNPNSPNASIIAEGIIKNASKYPNFVLKVVDYCSPELVRENISSILEILNNYNYNFNSNSPITSVIIECIIKNASKYPDFVLRVVDYCSSELLIENMSSILEILNNAHYYQFNSNSPNASVIADAVVKDASKYPNLISKVVDYCSPELFLENITGILDILGNDYNFNPNSPNASVIADAVIKDASKYPDLVSKVVGSCSLDVLKVNIDIVLEILEKSDKYEFNKDSPNASAIADAVVKNASKYPDLVSKVVGSCSLDVLKANIDIVLEILKKSDNYWFNTGSPNASIIADNIIKNASKYPNLVSKVFNSCSLDVLEANIDVVLEILIQNGNYYLNPNSPSTRIIADNIIKNASKYPNLVLGLVDSCSPEVLKENIDKVLSLYNDLFDGNVQNNYLRISADLPIQIIELALQKVSTDVLKFIKIIPLENIDSPLLLRGIGDELLKLPNSVLAGYSVGFNFKNKCDLLFELEPKLKDFLYVFRGNTLLFIKNFSIIESFLDSCGIDSDKFWQYSLGSDYDFLSDLISIFDTDSISEFISIKNYFFNNFYDTSDIVVNTINNFINLVKNYCKYSELCRDIVNLDRALTDIEKAHIKFIFSRNETRLNISAVEDCFSAIEQLKEMYRADLANIHDYDVNAVEKIRNIACGIIFGENVFALKKKFDIFGNTVELEKLKFNNRDNLSLQSFINTMIIYTSMIEDVLAISDVNLLRRIANEMLNKFDIISKFSVLYDYSEQMRNLYGIEAECNLPDFLDAEFIESVIDKLLTEKYGVPVYDLSDKQYVLYAHVRSGIESIDSLVNGVATGLSNFICFSPISERNQRFYRNDPNMLIFGYTDVPHDNFVCSSVANMGSNSSIKPYDSRVSQISRTQRGIKETSSAPHGHNSESLYYREGLKPSCIILPGGRVPTSDEIRIAKDNNLVFVITQQNNTSISNPVKINSSSQRTIITDNDFSSIVGGLRKIFTTKSLTVGPRKIAIIADAHGLYQPTLAAVLDAEKSGVSEIYSLGDNIGTGPNPKEVLEFLDEHGVTSIKGNHESYVIDGVENFAQHLSGASFDEALQNSLWTRGQLTEKQVQNLNTYESFVELIVGGKKLLLVHSVSDYNTGEMIVDPSKYDLIIQGHVHFESSGSGNIRTARALGVGGKGDQRASYIIIEENPSGGYSLEVRKIEYDVKSQLYDINASSLSAEDKSKIRFWISGR